MIQGNKLFHFCGFQKINLFPKHKWSIAVLNI